MAGQAKAGAALAAVVVVVAPDDFAAAAVIALAAMESPSACCIFRVSSTDGSSREAASRRRRSRAVAPTTRSWVGSLESGGVMRFTRSRGSFAAHRQLETTDHDAKLLARPAEARGHGAERDLQRRRDLRRRQSLELEHHEHLGEIGIDLRQRQIAQLNGRPLVARAARL